MMASQILAGLLLLAVALPASGRNENSVRANLPPESCVPPALSLQELSAAASNDGILKWSSGFAGALEKAKVQHREVLVYFRAEGCTDCDRMQAGAMADGYMQTRLSSFNLVRVDKTADAKLAGRYNISAVPAFVRVSSEGEVVQKHVGIMDKDTFLQFLRQKPN